MYPGFAHTDMVNRLEWMRKQLEDIRRMVRTQASSAELLRSVNAMDAKMQAVEFKLISRSGANSDDKYYVEPLKIYLNLIWLNGEVGTGAGDVAGAANYGVTDTVQVLLASIEKDLTAAKADYRSLMDRDLPAFNKQLTDGAAMAVSSGN